VTAVEFAAGAAWFTLYACTAHFAIRLLPERSSALVSLATACVLAAATLPAGAMIGIEANYWRALGVACFLIMSHLMVFGAVYKSISLHILLDLARAPSRRLSAEELFSRYIEQESFEARIQLMIAQGLAVHSRDGIALSPKGYRLAVAARFIQRLYGIERSG
jgi:hypothetical protein